MASLNISGIEWLKHAPESPWPCGPLFVPSVWLTLATSTGLLSTLTRPETCGQDWPPVAPHVMLATGVELARGANSVWNSVPEEAVESLAAIVLLTILTASESSSETPAPSQPATLLTMMLLVTLAEFQ